MQSASSVSTIGLPKKRRMMHGIILHGFSIAKCMHVRPITRYAVFLLPLSSLIYDGHAVENSKLELGANANESITRLEPELLDRSHTTWVRGFLPASQFISGGRSVTNDADIQTLKQCARDGRKVILTIKWDLKLAEWRVPAPNSEEEKKWFAWVDQLMGEMNGKISLLALINEVFEDTQPADLRPGANGRIPMVDFLQRLASHVANLHLQDAKEQALPLYCGGFTRLDTQGMQTNPAVLALMKWCASDPLITGVNFHLHERNYEQFESALHFLRHNVASKPFIVTEFSLVWAYQARLNDKLDGDPAGRKFVAHYNIPPELTVRDYINHCLAKPVSEKEWNDFIGSRSWLDPNFLVHSCSLMEKSGVTVATYAFSQRSSGGTRSLNTNTIPWLLNPIYVPGTAYAADTNKPAINVAWFSDYLLCQQKSSL